MAAIAPAQAIFQEAQERNLDSRCLELDHSQTNDLSAPWGFLFLRKHFSGFGISAVKDLKALVCHAALDSKPSFVQSVTTSRSSVESPSAEVSSGLCTSASQRSSGDLGTSLLLS